MIVSAAAGSASSAWTTLAVLSSAASASASSRERLQWIRTCQLSAASARLISAPIRRAPPVTMAVRGPSNSLVTGWR
jgi:hypothetical protein